MIKLAYNTIFLYGNTAIGIFRRKNQNNVSYLKVEQLPNIGDWKSYLKLN